jgi:hypothetical protein
MPEFGGCQHSVRAELLTIPIDQNHQGLDLRGALPDPSRAIFLILADVGLGSLLKSGLITDVPPLERWV